MSDGFYFLYYFCLCYQIVRFTLNSTLVTPLSFILASLYITSTIMSIVFNIFVLFCIIYTTNHIKNGVFNTENPCRYIINDMVFMFIFHKCYLFQRPTKRQTTENTDFYINIYFLFLKIYFFLKYLYVLYA